MNKLLISTAVVLTMGITAAASAQTTDAATASLRNNPACTPTAAEAGDATGKWFKNLDTDASGDISKREYELQCMAANTGSGAEGDEYSREQARKNFSFLDSNSDEKVDNNEYSAAAGNTQIKWQTAQAGQMDPHFGKMRAGEVIGKEVVDEDGKPVGTIQAIVVDPKGTKKYSVVSVQRYLDIGDKVVALPVQNFLVRDDRIMLRDTSNKLKQAPDYDAKAYKEGNPDDVLSSKEERLQD